MTRRSSKRRHSDPFTILAIVAIVLGMVLVTAAAVFWFLTGQESATIMGAGVTLAIGGGLRNMLAGIIERMPTYEPPPRDLKPRNRNRDREG